MAGLLPSETEVDVDDPEADPRVVGVDTADADEVLGALSAGTARRLLAELHDEPATPSALADAADTSLQNTQYHLRKLEEADLIEVRGTRYSEKGREMNVYAPTDGPLVLFAGDEEESAGVQAALAQLLGGIGVLSATGGVIKWWLSHSSTTGGGAAGGEVSVSPSADLSGAIHQGGTHLSTDPGIISKAPAASLDTAFGVAPGLSLFLGGVLALLLVTVWWGIESKVGV
ncbi:MAG: ArsR/SmtB family transcription factor [Halobacteriaceae archaeon]